MMMTRRLEGRQAEEREEGAYGTFVSSLTSLGWPRLCCWYASSGLCLWMSQPRVSGLQREVLALYRSVLRAARRKDQTMGGQGTYHFARNEFRKSVSVGHLECPAPIKLTPPSSFHHQPPPSPHFLESSTVINPNCIDIPFSSGSHSSYQQHHHATSRSPPLCNHHHVTTATTVTASTTTTTTRVNLL